MINLHDVTKENIKEHNPNWARIPDHTYRILLNGDHLSGKTNSLFNSISYEPDIDQIYLHPKDLYKSKYQFSIMKPGSTGLKHLNDSKSFIKYSNDM